METIRVANMHDRAGDPGAVAQIARMIADVGGTTRMIGTTMEVQAPPDAMRKIRRGFAALGAVLVEPDAAASDA